MTLLDHCLSALPIFASAAAAPMSFVDARLRPLPAVCVRVCGTPRNTRFGLLGYSDRALKVEFLLYAQANSVDPELTHLIVTAKDDLLSEIALRRLGGGGRDRQQQRANTRAGRFVNSYEGDRGSSVTEI